jgi:hypothetical protein
LHDLRHEPPEFDPRAFPQLRARPGRHHRSWRQRYSERLIYERYTPQRHAHG